jgi:hypothetical protein
VGQPGVHVSQTLLAAATRGCAIRGGKRMLLGTSDNSERAIVIVDMALSDAPLIVVNFSYRTRSRASDPDAGRILRRCGLDFGGLPPWWCGFCQTWFCQRTECVEEHEKHPFPL